MAEFLSIVEDLDGDFPPSYSETISANSIPCSGLASSNASRSTAASNPRLPASVTSTFTSPIASHLSSLPARLRSAQQAHANEQAARDLETIAVLAPAVETFLQDLGNNPSGRPPPVAELTLVPASAVPRGWALSGAAERRREGEVVRVVRVEGLTSTPTGDTKGASDKKQKGEKASSSSSWNNAQNDDDDDEGYTYTGARSAGFDEWGRFNDGDDDAQTDAGADTYFKDERMARRLAGYLQPKEVVVVERKQIQQAVSDAKKEKGFRWGRKKSEGSPSVASSSSSSQVVTTQAENMGKGSSLGAAPMVQGDDWVNMAVRADEVTFRKENDFGVWESRSGYGIVVTIRVKKT